MILENKKGIEFDELSSKVIAAALNVHKKLGPGFLENIYEQAMIIEIRKNDIKCEQQKPIVIIYDNKEIGKHVLDIVVEDNLILELKAVDSLEDIHFAQLRSYLRATDKKVGLLLNFNSTTLVIKRIVNNF